jgi:hypothetical protein
MLLPFAAFAQGQPAVQRTMSAPPPAPTTNAQPDAIDNMLRQYRTMWQKMSPAQQKAFLDSGGSTPEQYERTLRAKGPSALPTSPAPSQAGRHAPPDPHATADALDSLTNSLQDLNAIRDGNLERVQKDGCPPEVTSRLTDLRARLRQKEAELAGADAPGAVPVPAKDRTGSADAMAIAGDWFKRPQAAEKTPEAPRDTKENKLLSDVLPAAPAQRTASQPLKADKDQKGLEGEITRLKGEIAQLSSACAAVKR